MADSKGRDRDDPLYDWPSELISKAWPRLPLHSLECGHVAALWDEDTGFCRICRRFVKIKGE